MTLDIDITELKGREIVKILTMYPYGRLEIKYERVFWCSESSEPELTRRSPGDSPDFRGAPPQKEDWSKRFRKMSDTLGSMVGPAQ